MARRLLAMRLWLRAALRRLRLARWLWPGCFGLGFGLGAVTGPFLAPPVYAPPVIYAPPPVYYAPPVVAYPSYGW